MAKQIKTEARLCRFEYFVNNGTLYGRNALLTKLTEEATVTKVGKRKAFPNAQL